MPQQDFDIDGRIEQLRARMRWLNAIGFTANVTLGALGMSLVLVVLGRLAAWPALLLWALLPFGLALVSGGVFFFLRRPSRFDAAAAADQALGLKARLATMVHAEQTGPPQAIAAAQRADARTHAQEAAWERAYPALVPERARWITVPLVAIVAVLLYPGRTEDNGTVLLQAAPPSAAADNAQTVGAAPGELPQAAALPQKDTAPEAQQTAPPATPDPVTSPSTTELLEQTRRALEQIRQEKGRATGSAEAGESTGSGAGAADAPDAGGSTPPRDTLSSYGAMPADEWAEAAEAYPGYADVLRRYFAP
jgi:hypothetical protein